MQKKTTLFGLVKKSKNLFEKENEKKQYETTSGNGSLKYSTTGNSFVDEFGSLARYRDPRNIDDIFQTMDNLCSIDPRQALIVSTYMRIITRDTKYLGESIGTHRGQGLKHEYINRLYYILRNYKDWFIENKWIIPAAGCWEDVFELARICLYYEGVGSKNFQLVINFIQEGLTDYNNRELIRKYLPQMKTAKKCGNNIYRQANNVIAKTIAKRLFSNVQNPRKLGKYYRQYKTQGTAHDWQKLISQGRFDEIDFNKIAGKALALITDSKFLKNHNLEDKYLDWISEQPVAKFTGFVYELFKNASNNLPTYKKLTINKQFMQLVNNAKIDANSSLLCCIDTSGSMDSRASGTSVSCIDVARSIALYFSYLVQGRFQGTYVEFDGNCRVKFWEGISPLDKFLKNRHRAYASTDPLQIAHLLVNLKNKGYKEEEFPTGCLMLSDNEFNYCGNITTFDKFLAILRQGGFSNEFVDNFRLILWDLSNNYYGGHEAKFESFADRENFFYLSGLDPAVLSFMFNVDPKTKSTPKTAEELYKAAMEQPLLQKITYYKDQIQQL